MSGKFITIEGTDGAGKTTQINLLKLELEKMGYDIIITREPGGTPIGEKIRSIILDGANTQIDNATEILLYAASRAQHVVEKIIPALRAEKIVICDRFADSTIVYQSFARGIDRKFVEKINTFAVSGLEPDITLFFDISPENGMERKKKSKKLDRIESEDMEFHKRVYNGYKSLCREFPERIVPIDAQKSVEDVHIQVMEAVKAIL